VKLTEFHIGVLLGAVLGVSVFSVWYVNTKGHLDPSNKTVFSSPPTAVDPPPSYLLINGERWYVYPSDYSQNEHHTDGETSCTQRYIWFDSSERNRTQLREIMWHEIFHASYCYQGNRMKANWSQYVHDYGEHEIVYEAGMFLPGFVHDNPEFMKWAEEWK